MSYYSTNHHGGGTSLREVYGGGGTAFSDPLAFQTSASRRAYSSPGIHHADEAARQSSSYYSSASNNSGYGNTTATADDNSYLPRRYNLGDSPSSRAAAAGGGSVTPRGRGGALETHTTLSYQSSVGGNGHNDSYGLTPQSQRYMAPNGPGGSAGGSSSSYRRSTTPVGTRATAAGSASRYGGASSGYDDAHTISAVSRRLDMNSGGYNDNNSNATNSSNYITPNSTADRSRYNSINSLRDYAQQSATYGAPRAAQSQYGSSSKANTMSSLGNVTQVVDDDDDDYSIPTTATYFERPGSPARTNRYKAMTSAFDSGRVCRNPSMVKEANRAFLPECEPQDVGKLVVVLDLDETLVYAREGRTCVRPGCRELLQSLQGKCELLVWTAGERSYAQGVIAEIDTTNAIQHCVYRHPKWWTGKAGYTKNLLALGRPLDRTIIVDNTPDCLRDHPHHSLLVSDYLGKPHESNDRTLFILKDVVMNMIANPYRSVPQVLGSDQDIALRHVSCDTGGSIEVFTLSQDAHLGSSGFLGSRHNRDMPTIPSSSYGGGSRLSRW